jgi:transposase
MNEEANEGKLRQKKARGSRDLRDSVIVAKAMTGMSGAAIAEEMRVSRHTVSKALNSDQVKEQIHDLEARLAAGLDDAVRTVLEAVKVDYLAARDLIRSRGAMQARVNLELSQKLTLEELVEGSREDQNENEGE